MIQQIRDCQLISRLWPKVTTWLASCFLYLVVFSLSGVLPTAARHGIPVLGQLLGSRYFIQCWYSCYFCIICLNTKPIAHGLGGKKLFLNVDHCYCLKAWLARFHVWAVSLPKNLWPSPWIVFPRKKALSCKGQQKSSKAKMGKSEERRAETYFCEANIVISVHNYVRNYLFISNTPIVR